MMLLIYYFLLFYVLFYILKMFARTCQDDSMTVTPIVWKAFRYTLCYTRSQTNLDILTFAIPVSRTMLKNLINERMNAHSNNMSVTQRQTWGAGMTERRKRNKTKIKSLVERLGRGQRKEFWSQPQKGGVSAVFSGYGPLWHLGF